MNRIFYKAQSAVELGIVIALIAIITCMTLTPLGGQIYAMFQNLAPQKTIAASFNEFTGLMSEDTYNQVSSDITLLASSSNSDVQKIAAQIKSLMDVIGHVNSGQGQIINDEDLNNVAKQIKDSNTSVTETSGSLALIVANLTKNVQLTTEENNAVNEIKNSMDVKIIIKTNETLNNQVNEVANTIKTEIESSKLPKTVLQYEYSPVNNVNLDTADINLIFNNNYVISNTTSTTSQDTALNTYLLSQNATKNYNAGSNLVLQAESLVGNMKKSIDVE